VAIIGLLALPMRLDVIVEYVAGFAFGLFNVWLVWTGFKRGMRTERPREPVRGTDHEPARGVKAHDARE
jgi:hypothetical protein